MERQVAGIPLQGGKRSLGEHALQGVSNKLMSSTCQLLLLLLYVSLNVHFVPHPGYIYSKFSSLSLDKLLHDCCYAIRWDRKTHAIGRGVGLGIDSGQCGDADELPLQIDQGSTAIAGINGSIGLDGLRDGGSG